MRESFVKRTFAAALWAASGHLALAVSAGAQVAVNAEALAPFFDQAASGRVDVVGIGDSNQLYAGHGWDTGWAVALAERYGLFATGLHSAGENGIVGAGVGYGSGMLVPGVNPYRSTGANAELTAFLNAGAADVRPLGYLWLPDAQTAPWNFGVGLFVSTISPIDINGPLRATIAYALISDSGVSISPPPLQGPPPDASGEPGEPGEPDGGIGDPPQPPDLPRTGSFRPGVRLEGGSFATLASAPMTTTRTEPGPLVPSRTELLHIDVPAGARGAPVSVRYAQVGGDPVVGPFMAYYVRMENTSRGGAAMHTLYGYGGQSGRDMGAALQALSDESLALFFGMIRSAQGPQKRVLVRINTGLNDRQETLPSVGPAGATPGDSAAAYADNLAAIMQRIRQVWQGEGWAEDELYFLLTPSHAVSTPDDGELTAYRAAAAALALATPRCAFVDLSLLAPAGEILASGWYQAGGVDVNHLTQAGFEELSRRELAALVGSPIPARCPADWNRDGAVDDLDIAAFFVSFESGEADVDGSDSTDDLDVGAFFEAFAQGC